MLRFKVSISIVIAIILAFSANGQVNVYSNAINFRQNNANDKQQNTYHYGGLNIYANTSYGVGAYNDYSYGIGVFGQGNTGVEGVSSGSGSYNTNYAGSFYAYNAGYNYGIYTYAAGYGNYNNYGIYSYGGGTGSYAGYFSGDVTVTGTFSNPSDQKFKTNVVALDNCLLKVMGLKPKAFNYDTATYSGMGFSGKKYFGLIAQDVATVMPTVVVDNVANQVVVDKATGKPVDNKKIQCKAISYLELIPVLVGAIQEQQAEIEALKAKIK